MYITDNIIVVSRCLRKSDWRANEAAEILYYDMPEIIWC